MKSSIYRSLAALAAFATIWAGLALPAKAQTGPWTWSDLSDKLSDRTNRPVWTVIRAEPYWYMTDGQELWSGGHVWKTDGSSVSDITLNVRNAGLSRVDDMVSDGQTVLFLKDIARTNNQFQVVSYNGSYTDRTSILRSYINSNEGITSINGSNGTWMIVTSQNRVFNWNLSANTMTQISLPFSMPYTNVNATDNLSSYAIRHTSPVDGDTSFRVTQVLPTGNGWIFVIPNVNGTNGHGWSSTNWQIYQYSNGSFVNLTSNFSPSNPYYIATAASNGSQVFLVSAYNSNASDRMAWVIENSTVRSVNNIPGINWSKAVVSYNGKSWMILSDKDLVRFDGTNFQNYGQTNDALTTMAGNSNGTFLVGGAVSTAGYIGPTPPLTAKLVRVDEGTGYVAPTNVVTNSSNTVSSDEKITTAAGTKNRITYRAFFTPDWALQDNISDPKYTVVAKSSDGLKRIELYINDVRQKVCDGKNSKNNVTCAMFIESTGYVYDEDVSVYAKLTSSKGLVTWVPVRDIQFHNGTVNHSSAATATGNEGPVTASMTVSNTAHTLARGTNVAINATASAPAGLNRMELYVNGSVKSTCSVSGTYNTCNFTLGTDYPAGSSIAFNVRAVDMNGRDGWTWLGTYDIADYGYNGTTNNSNDVTGSLYVDSWTGSGSSLGANVKVTGSSPNGLNRIDLYANGSLYRTCTYSQTYGTLTCSNTVWASSFTYQTTVPIYAIVTDSSGHQFTTGTINLGFTGNGTSNNNNYNGNNTGSTNGLSVWFNADVANNSTLRRDLTKTVRIYGQSDKGLSKLEIFVNNNLVQQCTVANIVNTQSVCETTLYGSNYSDGSNININARATDQYGNTTWSSTIYMTINSLGGGSGSGNASTYVTVSPSDSSWNRSTSRYITAYGSDSDGMSRLDIYVNGANYHSCTFSNVYDTESCSVTVNGTDFAAGNSVGVYSRLTDRYGNTTDSSTLTYQMSNGTNQNGTASITYSPSKTTYNPTDTVNAYVTASDSDGIRTIDIYANGSIVNTCSASSNTSYNCSSNIYLGNYPSYSQVLVQAKVTDVNYNVYWTTTSYLQISASNNNGTSLSAWLSPNQTTFQRSDMPTFTVQASDNDGLQGIQLYKNGVEWKYCSGSGSTTLTCSSQADLSNLSYGATVTFQGKAIDSNSNVTWTNTLTATIAGQTSNTPSTINMTLSPDKTSYPRADTFQLSVSASDPEGVKTIDLYANGSLLTSCSNTSCGYSISGSSYSGQTSIALQAKVTDNQNNVTWSSTRTVQFTDTNNTVDHPGTIAVTTDAANGYTADQRVTFTAAGSDPDGIGRIEILVNAQIVQTCTGVGTCSFTGGPYTSNYVTYGANLYDSQGNRTWTGYQTISKK